MKKIISITSALVLIFALAAVSSAEASEESAQDFYQQIEGVVSSPENPEPAQDYSARIPEGFPGSPVSTFLYREGDTVYEMNSENYNAANGIILQMIDQVNEEGTPAAFVEEAAGFPVQSFFVQPAETDGETPDAEVTEGETPDSEVPNAEAPDSDSADQPVLKNSKVSLNISDGNYEGDIYNATGYYAPDADILEVNISEGAELTGDIALSSYVHGVMLGDKKAQDIINTINEINGDSEPGIIGYVLIDSRGQVTDTEEDACAVQFTRFPAGIQSISDSVINYINYNGKSEVQVNVSGTWKVRSAALITYLNVDEKAAVYGEIIELADKSLLIIPSEETVKPGEYGTLEK